MKTSVSDVFGAHSESAAKLGIIILKANYKLLRRRPMTWGLCQLTCSAISQGTKIDDVMNRIHALGNKGIRNRACVISYALASPSNISVTNHHLLP